MFSAIKMSGPDQRLDEISEVISEIINSYEVNIGEDAIPVKAVSGIGGHNIKKNTVHGGKLILSQPNYEVQGDDKMEEDEVYAIETYASTGNGIITQNDELPKCTHFMGVDINEVNNNKHINKHEKKMFRRMDGFEWMEKRKGLPFSYSWAYGKVPKVEKFIKTGVESGQILAYPPLYDEENSVVAQFEPVSYTHLRAHET